MSMSDGGDQLFFDSQPSTPKGSSKGAQLYQSYMTNTAIASYSDTYIRKLRKGQSAPPPDAAGVICGSRYQGRTTPLKGKGTPPADDKNINWIASKSLVPGRSFISVSDLLIHSSPVQYFDGSPDSTSRTGTSASHNRPSPVRTCMRLLDQSFRTSLNGPGLSIVAEEPCMRSSKNGSDFPQRTDTAKRVFSLKESGEDVQLGKSNIKWATQLAIAKEAAAAETAARPQTAPASGAEKHQTEARRYYHADVVGHQDVIRYRFSGGICPAEYKFEDVRKSVPQLEVKRPGSAKEVFFDARSSYSYNRVRALSSNTSVF